MRCLTRTAAAASLTETAIPGKSSSVRQQPGGQACPAATAVEDAMEAARHEQVPSTSVAHSVRPETRDMYAKMMEGFRDWLAEAQPLASLETITMLTMITMNLYLQPGEAGGLETPSAITSVKSLEQRCRHSGVNLLLSFRARPSKTQQFDESILLDAPTRPLLGDLLVRLTLEDHDCLRMWTQSQDGCLVTFGLREFLLRLCLPHAQLYVLRDTGASEDLLSKQQTLNEVRKQNRCFVETSLR